MTRLARACRALALAALFATAVGLASGAPWYWPLGAAVAGAVLAGVSAGISRARPTNKDSL